jgi:L-lactate dehydrogenase complex protein LldF
VPFVKQEVLKMAGRLLASPTLYRATVASLGGALRRLPNFVLYNPLNIWGRQRELPDAPKQTFHEWYKANRVKREHRNDDGSGDGNAKGERS